MSVSPPSESAGQAGYVRRFTRVVEYIYAHLDEAPDLNEFKHTSLKR